MDATKGLYFSYNIANIVQKGFLATILPLPCKIGNDNDILKYKKEIMKNKSLVACFALPRDLFYSNANVNACIMLFKLDILHCNYDKETFLIIARTIDSLNLKI